MHPTDRKEREQDLGKTVETRDGERGRERRDVFQFERATQLWGHYTIQRYAVRRIPTRPPYRGLALVLGGTALFVLAAMGFPGKVPQILLVERWKDGKRWSVRSLVNGVPAMTPRPEFNPCDSGGHRTCACDSRILACQFARSLTPCRGRTAWRWRLHGRGSTTASPKCPCW